MLKRTQQNKNKIESVNIGGGRQNENNEDNRIAIVSAVPAVENPINVRSVAISAVQSSAAVGQVWRGMEIPDDQAEAHEEALNQNTEIINQVTAAHKKIKELEKSLWWCRAGLYISSCAFVGMACRNAFKTGATVNKEQTPKPTNDTPSDVHVQAPEIKGGSIKFNYPTPESIKSIWKGGK